MRHYLISIWYAFTGVLAFIRIAPSIIHFILTTETPKD